MRLMGNRGMERCKIGVAGEVRGECSVGPRAELGWVGGAAEREG